MMARSNPLTLGLGDVNQVALDAGEPLVNVFFARRLQERLAMPADKCKNFDSFLHDWPSREAKWTGVWLGLQALFYAIPSPLSGRNLPAITHHTPRVRAGCACLSNRLRRHKFDGPIAVPNLKEVVQPEQRGIMSAHFPSI